MDVFELRDRLVGDYGSYVQSFIRIKDPRVEDEVNRSKWKGEEDLTLTKNEILCFRNEPELLEFALVIVGEGEPRPPRYLREHVFGEPDFAETTRAFSLRRLLEASGQPK